MSLLRLLLDLLPQRLQLGEALLDQLGGRAAPPQRVLAALEDVVEARLVTLDLLLQGLRGGERGEGVRDNTWNTFREDLDG